MSLYAVWLMFHPEPFKHPEPPPIPVSVHPAIKAIHRVVPVKNYTTTQCGSNLQNPGSLKGVTPCGPYQRTNSQSIYSSHGDCELTHSSECIKIWRRVRSLHEEATGLTGRSNSSAYKEDSEGLEGRNKY